MLVLVIVSCIQVLEDREVKRQNNVIRLEEDKENNFINSVLRETNAKAPIYLDEMTRFDKIDYKNGILISYHTLLGTDLFDMDEFGSLMYPDLKNGYCGTEYSKREIPVQYVYMNQQGESLTNFLLKSSDCS